jgi:hypothetical protein
MLKSVTDAQELLKAATKDESWVAKALPVAIDLSKMDAGLDAEKAAELEPLKPIVDEINKKYKADLDAIKSLIGTGGALRTAIAVTHKGTEAVKGDCGMITFSEKWDYEITGKVEHKYLHTVPDETAIRAAVDAGIRKIAGVRIFAKNVITIRPAK